MRHHMFMGIGLLVAAVGCSGGPSLESHPSPAGSVGTRGVLTDGTGVVRTTGERSTAVTLGIPPGHLPEPGQCRVWAPGQPPGQQRRMPQGACSVVERQVRPGQWLVYRPGENKKIVEVRTYRASGVGVVIDLVRVFDIATGSLLSER